MGAQQDTEIIAVNSYHKLCYLEINNLTTHFTLTGSKERGKWMASPLMQSTGGEKDV